MAHPKADPSKTSDGWVRWTCILLCIVSVVAILHVGKAVILPIAFAVLGAMTFALPVRKLHQWRIPNPLAAAAVMICFISVGCWATVYLGKPAMEWFSSVPERLPELRQKFQQIAKPAAKLSQAATQVEELTSLSKTNGAPTVEVKDKRATSTFFSWTGGLVGRIAESLTLMFLILASGEGLSQKAVKIISQPPDRQRAVKVIETIQGNISSYLLSVSAINLGVGLLLSLVFYSLGLPNALMWGAIAALLNYIPYFGPITGMALVAAAGLWSKDNVLAALLPPFLYLAVHAIEANIVTPYILGKRFALDPVLIFIVLLLGVALWGGAGAFLAMPALVTFKAICDSIPKLRSVSEVLNPKQSLGRTTPSSHNAERGTAAADKMPYPKHASLSTTHL